MPQGGPPRLRWHARDPVQAQHPVGAHGGGASAAAVDDAAMDASQVVLGQVEDELIEVPRPELGRTARVVVVVVVVVATVHPPQLLFGHIFADHADREVQSLLGGHRRRPPRQDGAVGQPPHWIVVPLPPAAAAAAAVVVPAERVRPEATLAHRPHDLQRLVPPLPLVSDLSVLKTLPPCPPLLKKHG